MVVLIFQCSLHYSVPRACSLPPDAIFESRILKFTLQILINVIAVCSCWQKTLQDRKLHHNRMSVIYSKWQAPDLRIISGQDHCIILSKGLEEEFIMKIGKKEWNPFWIMKYLISFIMNLSIVSFWHVFELLNASKPQHAGFSKSKTGSVKITPCACVFQIWQDFMFACALYPSDSDFMETVRKEVTHQVSWTHSHTASPLVVCEHKPKEQLCGQKRLVNEWGQRRSWQ